MVLHVFRRCPAEEPHWGCGWQGWRGRAESCIFMMNVNFNSRVIVHCARVQRKFGPTQEIYITSDSACIWKCLPQVLLKLPLKPNTATTVCADNRHIINCFNRSHTVVKTPSHLSLNYTHPLQGKYKSVMLCHLRAVWDINVYEPCL